MAYDVFKIHATDAVKELVGVEVPIGGDAFLTVARAENDNFLTRILEETEKHAASFKSLPEDEAKALDILVLCEVMAETILLGFKGMSYDGKPVKYSKKTAVKLLKHVDFRKLVMRHATNIENFRLEEETADAKK